MAMLAEKLIDAAHHEAPVIEGRPEELRLLEALLFASPEPLDTAALAKKMPQGVDIKAALAQLQADYASRGVNLVRIAGKWTFRTAGDLAWLMTRESTETRRLSRAAIEMLAIIAYHQPVTRAEIEEIRGVVTSKGTLDVLLETGWIKPRGRRKTPGRPLTFGTTEAFLSQFTLENLTDLPGLEELKGAGLLDSRLPGGFAVPMPSDDPAPRDDEDPLEDGDELSLTVPLDPELELGSAAREAVAHDVAQEMTGKTSENGPRTPSDEEAKPDSPIDPDAPDMAEARSEADDVVEQPDGGEAIDDDAGGRGTGSVEQSPDRVETAPDSPPDERS
jgi:segregation and condensation protein B